MLGCIAGASVGLVLTASQLKVRDACALAQPLEIRGEYAISREETDLSLLSIFNEQDGWLNKLCVACCCCTSYLTTWQLEGGSVDVANDSARVRLLAPRNRAAVRVCDKELFPSAEVCIVSLALFAFLLHTDRL
jgi:hypothetical protein